MSLDLEMYYEPKEHGNDLCPDASIPSICCISPTAALFLVLRIKTTGEGGSKSVGSKSPHPQSNMGNLQP